MDVISFSEAATANSRIEKINANPDSTSGIVTVPKTIASGETVTIPAGRVAILPNVQVDGVINIEGEVFVPSGSTYGDLDAQIALKADTSYVNTQLGLKANTTDLKEIGVGQTWQDVTASRASGVTYTNSTGKPIALEVACETKSTNTIIKFVINGTPQGRTGAGASVGIGDVKILSIIVPNGATYACTVFAGSFALDTWFELR